MTDSEKLFDVIETLIKKALKKISYDKEGMVLDSSSTSMCDVALDGHTYKITNGTNMNFTRGDKVLVHYINGNMNNKIIIAKM